MDSIPAIEIGEDGRPVTPTHDGADSGEAFSFKYDGASPPTRRILAEAAGNLTLAGEEAVIRPPGSLGPDRSRTATLGLFRVRRNITAGRGDLSRVRHLQVHRMWHQPRLMRFRALEFRLGAALP